MVKVKGFPSSIFMFGQLLTYVSDARNNKHKKDRRDKLLYEIRGVFFYKFKIVIISRRIRKFGKKNKKERKCALRHCTYPSRPFNTFPQQLTFLHRLTPNDPYMGRTAPLTSKRCILYIYSTNIGTEYFKHALHSPFFPLQNAVRFIMLTCLVPVLFTFYIQDVLKLKK